MMDNLIYKVSGLENENCRLKDTLDKIKIMVSEIREHAKCGNNIEDIINLTDTINDYITEVS
jgi:hypothetical protein